MRYGVFSEGLGEKLVSFGVLIHVLLLHALLLHTVRFHPSPFHWSVSKLVELVLWS